MPNTVTLHVAHLEPVVHVVAHPVPSWYSISCHLYSGYVVLVRTAAAENRGNVSGLAWAPMWREQRSYLEPRDHPVSIRTCAHRPSTSPRAPRWRNLLRRDARRHPRRRVKPVTFDLMTPLLQLATSSWFSFRCESESLLLVLVLILYMTSV